jgi:hypothetical protein
VINQQAFGTLLLAANDWNSLPVIFRAKGSSTGGTAVVLTIYQNTASACSGATPTFTFRPALTQLSY